MKRNPRVLPRALRVLSLVCAAHALLAANVAQAQIAPYYLDASQAVTYDSNLFRVSTAERSDVISTTALTVGIDQPISRQRLLAHATGRYNLYRDNDQLNAPGYDIGAGINWEAASRLSGHARVNFSQSQAAFENYGALQQVQSGKNLERVSVLDLRGQYGGQSLLSVEALANLTHVRYSSSQFAGRELRSRMLGVGMGYRPSNDWVLGIRLRRTNGEYGGGIADEYDRDDIDFTARYQASGFSSISGRLSHTKEDHDLDTARNFSGVTGEVRWDYQATGKLGLGVSAARETGSGASIGGLTNAATSAGAGAGIGSGTGTSSDSPAPPLAGTAGGPLTASSGPGYLTDSQLSNRFGLQARFDATAKIRLNATVNYSRDRYDTRFVTGGAGTGGTTSRGNTRQWLLGADYLATRVWNFGCGVGREDRSTLLVLAGNTPYAYDVTTAYCNARLSLR